MRNIRIEPMFSALALYADPSRTCRDVRQGANLRPEQVPQHMGQNGGYSITSSARMSNEGDIVRPSALAVLRLIVSRYRVGCMTGRSPGLAPWRIRPVYRPTCW